MIRLASDLVDCLEAALDGKVTTHGGRVNCATALGNNVTEAQQNAYKLAKIISCKGMFYRDDIAYRAIAREQNN
jgi:phosphoribosylamine--glycine ligase